MQASLHGKCSYMSHDAVDGSTRLVGLIGKDVLRSRSFAMHNAAFAALGLNWRYLPLPVQSHRQLGQALQGMEAMGFAGANVTMPFKEAVMALAGDQGPEALRTGAANTLVHRPGGGWRARNSDVPGFLAALEWKGIAWKGREVLILGAGGAARAVASAISREPGPAIRIFNRNRERARSLEAAAEGQPRSVHALEALGGWNGTEDSLVVNCTPDGMGLAMEAGGITFGPGQSVVDLVYRQTPLLEKAAEEGAGVMNGMEMLVQQAAISFSWWTGESPPVRRMRAAAEGGEKT
jgi:shikimate dehydrogenase